MISPCYLISVLLAGLGALLEFKFNHSSVARRVAFFGIIIGLVFGLVGFLNSNRIDEVKDEISFLMNRLNDKNVENKDCHTKLLWLKQSELSDLKPFCFCYFLVKNTPKEALNNSPNQS